MLDLSGQGLRGISLKVIMVVLVLPGVMSEVRMLGKDGEREPKLQLEEKKGGRWGEGAEEEEEVQYDPCFVL